MRDLYRAVHKAMRRDLFEVSSLIAVTDFSSSSAVELLRARFDGLVGSMGHHAEMEDRDIHPLAHTAGLTEVTVLEAEHEVLDPELAALAEELAGLDAASGAGVWEDAHRFYLRFNRFVADYLHHTDREERELMPALVAAADGAVLDRLALADYEGPVEMLTGAMGNMMPLFNPDDRRQIVADIRMARSAEDFELVAEAAIASLGAGEWAKLVG